MYNILEELWESGGGKGEVPLKYSMNFEDDSKEQIHPFQLKELNNKRSHGNLTQSKSDKTFFQKKRQKQNDLISMRSDFSLKIKVAKSFKEINVSPPKYANCQEIYFPHNTDFRGRLYPITPHLNHMGNDVCRGLLEFSKGKPLGKRGLYWLKIHLANKLGHDKISFEDRIAYVDDLLPKIHKTIQDPLKHDWWLHEEDCWQALGIMHEISEAYRLDNPEEFIR